MSSDIRAPKFKPPAASVATGIKIIRPDNIEATKDARSLMLQVNCKSRVIIENFRGFHFLHK